MSEMEERPSEGMGRRLGSRSLWYLFPLVAVLAAFTAHITLAHFIAKRTDFPYAFFYLIAVFVTAWYAGYIPGAIACVLTMIGIPALFDRGFRLAQLDWGRLVILTGVALFISRLAENQKRRREMLRDANLELDRRVQERTQDLAQAVQALEAEIAQHKRTEAALHASEERVDFALEAAGIGLWNLDLTTHKAERTLRHDQIFGYEALEPEWTLDRLLDHIVPEDRLQVSEQFRAAIETGNACEFECRIRRRDDAVRWIWARGKIRREESGQATGILGTISDVTGRKQAEQAARQWQQVIERAGFGVAVIHPDRETLEVVNPAFAHMHGRTVDELRGAPLSDSVAPESLPELEAQRTILGEKGHHVYESTHIRKDGSRFPALNDMSALTDEQGRILLCAGYFQDMTAHKAAEETARETSERLNSILESISDGFLAVDRQWRHTYVNRRAAEMLRRSAEQLLGNSFWEALPIAGPPKSELQHVLDESVPIRLEFIHDPWKTWFDVSAHPTRDGIALFLRDITEQKRLADQLRQAQKMDAVGRLAGGIAHDFNNLLTVITGYADMMLQELPAGSEYRATVGEISNAAKRATEVTSGLLAFSRRQIVHRGIVDLNASIRGVEKMLRRLIREDIQITTTLAPDLWTVSADSSQLDQVILNLAVNARDAMPDGGTLSIETANVEIDQVYARGHLGVEAGKFVLLAVSDTGCGMDRETQSHIFEPFFTTKDPGKGTGLGLSITYGILRQNGGSISVYSELGRGTTFKVYLPQSVEMGAATPETAPVGVSPARRGRKAILLVEDDESLRKLTGIMLQRHGYQLLTAQTGAEALEICDRERGNIDLVLTDMVMPRMSGRQLGDEIRRRHPELSLLFMSGYTESAIANQDSLNLDGNFLGKPFTAAGLIAKVEEVLGKARRSQSLVEDQPG